MSAAWFDWLLNQPGGRSRGCRPLGNIHLIIVFVGVAGLKAADMAAVAPVLFPKMKARGASLGDLVALLAASGAQTETVPPSLVLIAIGSMTGVSISAPFTGGLLPRVVLSAR